MRHIKLLILTTVITVFITACGSTQTDQAAVTTNYPNDAPQTVNDNDVDYNDDYYAPENLDLRAVGDIFKESDSAADFERRLNSDDGVNNLDLNGDGYVDYISVNEYEDRDTGYRGFSLLDRFGGDAIQEIATIILDRTLNDGRGSRLYINGNDQIYGDDYVYRADWKDTTLDIVNWAFNDRSDYYESPYYYDNYPDYYETYRVIETPVYRSRIEQYYAAPIFIKTDYREVEKIKIKSKYKDKYYDKIYARIAKPNDFQKEFRKKNPKRPEFVSYKGENDEKYKDDKPDKVDKRERKEDKRDKKAEKRERNNNEVYDDQYKLKKNDVKSGKEYKPEKMEKDRDKGSGKAKGKNKNKGGKKEKDGKKGKN